MINLTVESVLKSLDELVEEYGAAHRYQRHSGDDGPGCLYAKVVDGEPVPDCIVGHVLVRHGFPVEELLFKRGRDGKVVNKYGVHSISDNLLKMIQEGLATAERGVVLLLDGVQSNQDWGMPWDDAVEKAKTVLHKF